MYLLAIRQIVKQCTDNRYKDASEALSSLPETMRHWEWDYLNLECWRPLFDTPGHKWAIYNVVFSPDSKYFATWGRESEIKIWDLAARREVATCRRQLAPGRGCECILAAFHGSVECRESSHRIPSTQQGNHHLGRTDGRAATDRLCDST